MQRDDILNILEESEALLADGFDDALIGCVTVFNRTVALYDREKCIAILMAQGQVPYEEATEHFEFNVQGAWVGEGTPGFATLIP